MSSYELRGKDLSLSTKQPSGIHMCKSKVLHGHLHQLVFAGHHSWPASMNLLYSPGEISHYIFQEKHGAVKWENVQTLA